MNQAELHHLVRGLRLKLWPGHRKLPETTTLGYRGALEKLRPTVTALIVNERLQLNPMVADLTRQYTEALVAIAVEKGDRHAETMDRAKWWLHNDPAAVHKLFQVLVPRFRDYTTSYTRILRAPSQYGVDGLIHDKFAGNRFMVELKGNPFPRLDYPNIRSNSKHLHNVLLAEARKEYNAAAAATSKTEKEEKT